MKKVNNYYLILMVLFGAVVELIAQPQIWHQRISETGINLRGNPVILAEIEVDIPEDGYVEVHFNGQCHSDIGDRIVFAASDEPNWSPDGGNVGYLNSSLTVSQGTFSHTRVYRVNAGIDTFYAVAENYVDYGGSGVAAIYASLTVKFFPERSGEPFVRYQPILKPYFNVRGTPVVVSQIDVTIPEDGNVLLRFDGECYASLGDLIILAASDQQDWSPNDGNIGIEVPDNSYNARSFSHSRLYPVFPGDYTFYAIAQNIIEEDGNGQISVYGMLTLEYFPLSNDNTLLLHQGINETFIDVRTNLVAVGQIDINPQTPGKAFVHFDGVCYPSVGDLLILAASNQYDWNINDGNLSVSVFDDDLNSIPFSHTQVYDLPAGLSSLYAVAHNYVELGGSGLASIYGSLTVEFFPDIQTSINTEELFPNEFKLNQNFPNPFNPTTSISFTLPEAGKIILTVHDVLGNEVAELIDKDFNAGRYEYTWNARNLSSGVYFMAMKVYSSSQSKELYQVIKMNLLK
ncbi:MAG: T9SS type A sorting domain-containing protein [bacterium]